MKMDIESEFRKFISTKMVLPGRTINCKKTLEKQREVAYTFRSSGVNLVGWGNKFSMKEIMTGRGGGGVG
jgi:hypothetical protein